MAGDARNGGGGGDTQVLDGGALLGEYGLFADCIVHPPPPSLNRVKALTLVGECVFFLGSPVSAGGETQPLDDAETQLVDEVEGMSADWMETQLVESGEEDGGDYGDQVETQLEVEYDEEDAGGVEDNACNGIRTQLVAECEAEGGNGGVDAMVDTQLVDESEEEEDRVNGGDEVDVGEWGKTQVVEDSDDELSEGTQVLTDSESLSDYEQDVALGLDGGIEGMNDKAGKHFDDKSVVDTDASTDDEGDAG
jgi:mediator of DNA damage checkpoint protein 1